MRSYRKRDKQSLRCEIGIVTRQIRHHGGGSDGRIQAQELRETRRGHVVGA
jgi:hypothetical protein